MSTTTFILRLSAASLLVAAPLAAQSAEAIASRVAAAPDGEVRLTYATRPNACGDGRDVVAIGEALNVHGSIESYGHWSGVRCEPGPARVAIAVREHRVVGLRPHVGGSWRDADGAVTDLGRVPAREAATYFLTLARQLGSSSRGSNPLLAAALADSADIGPALMDLARDQGLPRETRRRAVNFTGVVGTAAMARPLAELARARSAESENPDDVGPGNGVEGAAAGALAMLADGAGMSALMDIARTGAAPARKAAVFWLGQGDDPRGRALVRTIAADDRETEMVRGSAIFALGQGRDASAGDAAFLRGLFDRLPTNRLKERVLMAMGQSESAADQRWLVALVRDEGQPVEVRRKAAFWAGQGGVPLRELVALYRDVSEPRLREHLIFVLSQRGEHEATDALLSIARTDDDRRMRSKALFWLAQKNDPRVTKLIADIVTR